MKDSRKRSKDLSSNIISFHRPIGVWNARRRRQQPSPGGPRRRRTHRKWRCVVPCHPFTQPKALPLTKYRNISNLSNSSCLLSIHFTPMKSQEARLIIFSMYYSYTVKYVESLWGRFIFNQFWLTLTHSQRWVMQTKYLVTVGSQDTGIQLQLPLQILFNQSLIFLSFYLIIYLIFI